MRQQITEASVSFDYSDFFEKREEVQKKMSYAVGTKFKESYFVDMEFFFLKRAKIEQRHLDTKLTTLLNQQKVLFIAQEAQVKTIRDQIDNVKANSLAAVATID